MIYKKSTSLQKDFKRRNLVKFYEQKRLILKSLQNNLSLSKHKRFYVSIQLSKSKSFSQVRIQNRCVLTGRSHGVYKYFKISRIMIRELAAKGLLPGIKKASW